MSRPLSRLALIFIGLLALVASAVAPVAGSAPANNPPPKETLFVYRVVFRDTLDRDQLANTYDALEYPTTDGTLRIIGTADTAAELRQTGHSVTVDQPLTDGLNQPITWNHDTFYGGYRTVAEMYQLLDQRATQYPALATVVDIGDSWCKLHAGGCQITGPTLQWNGFDLKVMHLSNQNIPGPKPVFWFDTGIHSRELATSEVALMYIDYLLQNYDTNADIHWLVDYHDIYIMPSVNPDGHFMMEAGGNSPSSIGQRKNANYTNGCTSWQNSGSQLGTDLNRNYPFLWNCCGGSSGAACDQTYRGPSPASDPEVQQVTAYIRSVIPDQRGPQNTDPAPLTTTGIINNMHANAMQDLWPWGWTTATAPNGPDLANIGTHMSALNANPPGNNYEACQPTICLYATDGASDDWAYGELGAPAFTVELSGNSFYPTYSAVTSIFNENRGMLLYMSKIARAPYLQTRGPDSFNVAASPMTTTVGSPIQLTTSFNYAWTGNGYTQNIAAAEYYIDTPPWAGGTPFVMSPTDGNFNSPTEGGTATLNTTGLTLGRHIVFVRARGVNDYSGLHSWGPVSAQFFWLLGTPSPTPTGTLPTLTPTMTRTPTRTPTLSPTPSLTPSASPTFPAACNYQVAATSGASLIPGTANIGNACDDCVTNVTFPFPVNFYNTAYTTGNVSSNGNLQFNSADSQYTNACLPSAPLNSVVYGFWDDLITTGAGHGVFSATVGTAPNRTFVLEWRAAQFTGGATVNFEIQFHEGSPNFEVIYANVPAPTSATAGVQFLNGVAYLQYACNGGTLPAGTQLNYTVNSSCGVATATRTTSPTPTNTATATATSSATPTPGPSSTPTTPPTATATATHTPTPTPGPSSTPTTPPTDTPTTPPTDTPTPGPSSTPTTPPTDTPTPDPSSTPTTPPTDTPTTPPTQWMVFLPYFAQMGATTVR